MTSFFQVRQSNKPDKLNMQHHTSPLRKSIPPSASLMSIPHYSHLGVFTQMLTNTLPQLPLKVTLVPARIGLPSE